MIRLSNSTGKVVYLAPNAIASVTEAGVSSQWHGIKSFVKCFDGTVIEANDTATEIARMIEAQLKDQP